jgi:hypothetical protein
MLTHSPTAQPRKLTEVHRGLLIVISWDIQPDFCSGSLNAVLMPYALILTLAPSELTLMSIDQCPESSGPSILSFLGLLRFQNGGLLILDREQEGLSVVSPEKSAPRYSMGR